MTAPSLPAWLRADADGLYATEAATGLIIAHGAWIDRGDFARFIDIATSISDHTRDVAHINWAAATTALAVGSLPSSGGERRVLQIAASLADNVPVGLGEAVTSLDARSLALVLAAVTHASGRRQFPC